jgi:hypothetical protein
VDDSSPDVDAHGSEGDEGHSRASASFSSAIPDRPLAVSLRPRPKPRPRADREEGGAGTAPVDS